MARVSCVSNLNNFVVPDGTVAEPLVKTFRLGFGLQMRASWFLVQEVEFLKVWTLVDIE